MAGAPPQRDQVLVLLNLKAGHGSAGQEVERFQDLARHIGFQPTVQTDLAEATTRANQWHAEGRLRMLVGVGGDGTAMELVNRTMPGVPITLLAAGTANLLARHFRLATNAKELQQVVAAGQILKVDAGQVAGRLFIAMLSCGLDADVVRRVHDRRVMCPGSHSYWSFVKPLLQSIRSYQYPPLRVYCDQEDAKRSKCVVARWAFVCNLPRYGWGLALARGADATDGLLDLCTFARGSFWHGLGYATAAQLGIHGHLTGCALCRVRRLRIEADQPVPYQLDGDPGGELPVDIEVLPGRLTLAVPPRR
jgi:diacylglycerol kinase family enzyme